MILFKDTDFAYAAGIIDGEGAIMIHRQVCATCRSGFRQTLVVTVNTSDGLLTEWLCGFGGSVHKHVNKQGTQMYLWSIACKTAGDFLASILPYLRLKAEQAQLGIEFQAGQVRGGRLTDLQSEKQNGLREQLMALHSGKGRR